MANFFTMMFSKGKISELQEKNKQLEKALEECSGKLAEKQEHINQTNAFWKKKLREAKSATTTAKKLKKSNGSDGYMNPPLDA